MHKKIQVFLLGCLIVSFIFIRTGAAQDQDIKQLPKGLLLEAPKIQHSTVFNATSSTILFEETFEGNVSAWSLSGSWAIGNPTSGPNSGYNSTNCAATNLSENYSNNADDWLISPTITLTAADSASQFTLQFMEWFELESGYDYGYVKLSTDEGTTWTTISSRDGSSDWRQEQVDLTAYANQEIKVAFHLTTDRSVNFAGLYIDNVQISRDEPEPLTATITSLNSQNFPFIFMNVAVDTFGVGFPGLTKSNFQAYENDVLQTDFFEVTPPKEGGGVRLTDIVFLMDNSGSMNEEINAVRNNMVDFVDSLSARGVNFALGLCRFGAAQNSGYPIIEDNGILTADVDYFKNNVWNRNVIDGNFEPGWDALYESATTFSFRPGAQKIFILITDETPTDDGNIGNYSQSDAISILQANSITTFALLELSASHAISDYGVIAEQTNGQYFDILSPFDEILEFIGSQIANSYVVTYRSSNPLFDGTTRTVEVEVIYQAESDTAVTGYIPGAAPSIQRTDSTVALHDQPWAQGTSFNIEAEITDDIEPFVQSAKLFYKPTTDSTYLSVEMVLQGGNVYRGIIPGSDVVTPGMDYYITATDSVTTSSDPSTNPATNPYQLAILPNVAPEIEHTPVTSSTPGTEISIRAKIVDNTNFLASAKLYYRKTGQLLYQQTDMVSTADDNYEGVIPASFVTSNGVEYYIHAVDDFGVGSFSGTRDEPHVIGASQADLTPIREGGQWRAALSFEHSETGDDSVRITATIRNIGDAPATNVEVEIYDGDPGSGGTLIGTSTIAEIAADSSGIVSVDWQAGSTGGKNGIFVQVDPQNVIAESEEDNNIAEYYRRPLILVPGIAGSPLYESEDNLIEFEERVWVKWDPLLNFPEAIAELNEGFSKLAMNSDGTSSNTNVKAVPSNLGMVQEINRLPLIDTFGKLVDTLEINAPYNLFNDGLTVITRDRNLFLFFYDWRLKGDSASSELAAFVDSVKNWTDSDAVDIACHSLGGMIAKHAIKKGKISTDEVKHLFFFGTPHLGAPKLFYVFNTGKWLSRLKQLFFDGSLIKSLVRKSPGALQLVPSPDYFNVSGSYVSVLEEIPSDYYDSTPVALIRRPLDFTETKSLVRLPENEGAYDLAENFIDDISDVDMNGIRVINVIGVGTPTIVRVVEDAIDWDLDGWDTVCEPVGDGTVPSWSAAPLNLRQKYPFHLIPDVKHLDLPSHETSIELIKNYLYWYERLPTATTTTEASMVANLSSSSERHVSQIAFRILPGNTMSNSSPGSKIRLTSKGQVTSDDIVRVVDSQNRETKLTAGYEIIENIPGSILEVYGIPGDTLQIVVALPAEDDYQVYHHANDSMRTEAVRLQQGLEDDLQMQLTYMDVGVSPGGNIQFAMPAGLQEMAIVLDRDGDGVYETSDDPTFVFASKAINFSVPGWHLFSPPVDLSGGDVASIMANISSGIAYAWNGSSYFRPDTLRMGQGYWLPVLEPTSPIFSGAPKDSVTLHFMPGWHMIGPLSKTVDFTDPQDNPDGCILATFGWDASTQSYHTATNLEPGKGYWIAVAQECDWTIGGATSAITKAEQVKLDKAAFYKTFGQTPPPPPDVASQTGRSSQIPIQYELYQNYPNPFNPATTIRYGLPERSFVKLEVYNTLGQRIRVLVEKSQEAGYHEVVWNGKDSLGRTVSSGIYFYQLLAGDLILVKKGVLLK